MNKAVFILLLTIVICSCNNRSQSKIVILTSDSISYYKDKLMGNWGIYEENVMCNVCPKINFKVDNTAKITYGDGNLKSVKWQILKRDSLNINENDIFFNLNYQMRFQKMKDGAELILSNKNFTYILRPRY